MEDEFRILETTEIHVESASIRRGNANEHDGDMMYGTERKGPGIAYCSFSCILWSRFVSSTGVEHVVNRVVYCATGTEIYISAG
jgi:hypothetical protein